MSVGEDRAWQALPSMRRDGVHVVRQHEIGRFKVDVAVRKARIAIEVDGGVHEMDGRAEYDAKRQALIESKGWKFVRFTTDETLDPTHVINKVRAALPLPLRGGGGGQGEAPSNESSRQQRAKSSDAGGSPHPLAPSSQEEGELPRHLLRRTRANRKLPPRRKS